MIKLGTLLTLILLVCSSRFAVSKDSLTQGIELMNSAESLRDESLVESQQMYANAASFLEKAITDDGYRSASAYHALGNAYFRSDRLGKAVLNYRRGLQLNPTDPHLLASLKAVRLQIDVIPAKNAQGYFSQALTLVRSHVPRALIWGIIATTFCIGWFMLTLRLFTPSTRRMWTILASSSFACSIGASTALGYELYQAQSNDAVVVQSGFTVRTGPSESIYPKALDQNASPGLEVKVVDQRDGWSNIRFGHSSSGWISSDALERVFPGH